MKTSGNSNKVYWRMRNGQMIDVDLMDQNHLRNTLKLIIRNQQKRTAPKPFEMNGDMAQEFNTSCSQEEPCDNCHNCVNENDKFDSY